MGFEGPKAWQCIYLRQKLCKDVHKSGKDSLSVLLVGHGMWIQEFLMYLSDTEKIGPSEGGSGTNVHLPSANDLRA